MGSDGLPEEASWGQTKKAEPNPPPCVLAPVENGRRPEKMAIRDFRNPKRTTDQATLLQKAQALDEIATAVARYLGSEGRVRRDDLIADIANTIEMKTNYIFLERGEIKLPAFRMAAYERLV